MLGINTDPNPPVDRPWCFGARRMLLHAVSVSLRRRGDCLPSYSGSDVSARQLIIVVVVAVATRRPLFLLVVAADRRPPC